MKLSDYLADFLARAGVTKVFGLTGGAAVHLLDSVCRHPQLEAIFMHHEQAVAFAAQASARIRNDVGAAIVTTGPGGTNTITGLTAAWLDSIPCLYISGQVRLAHAKSADYARQVGTQHLDIISVIKPLTKYAVMLTDITRVRYELEKALFLARSGRPGPVWIDIPLDFQWADINPEHLESFTPESIECQSLKPKESDLHLFQQLLSESKRPLCLIGYGVRLAKAEKDALSFLERSGIPFLTSWNATDMLPASLQGNLGRPGIFGQRGANLAMQNCDLLIAIGSHLCISLTGTQTASFARQAKTVMVNVDNQQLSRSTVKVDLPIHSDAKNFLSRINSLDTRVSLLPEWTALCSRYRDEHTWVLPSAPGAAEPVNPYHLMDLLSTVLPSDSVVVVDGGGTVNQIAFQSFRTQPGQRMIISSALCSMGSGLPESVGACIQSGKKRTVCLNGDGSLQLNIQELQTIVHHALPLCIFVLCNGGYNSIRQTQDSFLGERRFGSQASGGMSLPDYSKVGAAYGMRIVEINCQADLAQGVHEALASQAPTLCLVKVSPDFKPEPRQGFATKADGSFAARPLEDMFPFLPRDDFKSLMCIPQVDIQ